MGLASEVYDTLLNGTSERYTQIYYGFPGAVNYTSPKLHTVVADTLLPNTTYYYRVGDATTQRWGKEHAFTTLPVGDTFPLSIGILGDVGQTYNSSDTFDHLAASKPQVVVFVGDLSYADCYQSNGSLGPELLYNDTSRQHKSHGQDAAGGGSFGPRWDTWAQLAEPVLSSTPSLFNTGNHELEPQSNGRTFVAYEARYPSGHNTSGSTSPFWYSQNLGPVHKIFITPYQPYGEGSAQYDWLEADLASINRSETPWVIVSTHAPWYTSYATAYMEVNCQRLAVEPLLYAHGVDVVISGHVHAFERTYPIYNFTLDTCGPIHLTVGDGGNVEKLAAVFVDDPGYCPAVPKHGTAAVPEVCTQMLYDGQYCPSSQPDWSAYREPSFGHAMLNILNDTHAQFAWHRNQDAKTAIGDEVMLERNPTQCGIPARIS